MSPKCLAPTYAGLGLLFVANCLVSGPTTDSSPERRAIAYLSIEVPKWSQENKCFSCHNNGDAARALYVASQLGYSVPDKALIDTTAWLTQPAKWDDNGGPSPFNNKKLARLQFATALTEATEAGLAKDPQAVRQAAEALAASQDKNGCWAVTADGIIGSPATHGTCLATGLARRTLRKADAERFRSAIQAADQWMRKAPVKSVLDAAAVALALAEDETADAMAQKRQCWELIRKGQSEDGGWGPYVTDPPEAFDTAVVILALAAQQKTQEWQPTVRRGRAYLVSLQQADGSWPETTRPTGAVSYAQRLSTTGWAALALLATKPKDADR